MIRRPRRRPGRKERFDAALAGTRRLERDLSATPAAPARAVTYDCLASLCETLRDTCDPASLGPLRAGAGTTWAQAYTARAALTRVLAYGEHRFGRYRGPAPARYLPGAAPGELAAWDRYLASTSRRERAALLAALHETVARRTGTEAASVLSVAASSELAITGGAH